MGWDGEDEYAFIGTEQDDGHTLVRVQLFDGRDITKPLKSRAQGHKIICQLSGGLFRVPDRDTRVYVICPKGMEHAPGAAIIIATVEKNPTEQFDNDRAMMDYGPNAHVVIRAKSISLQSYEDEFIAIGEPKSGGTSGLFFQAKDGSGGAIQEGVVAWFVSEDGNAETMFQMTPSGVQCFKKDGGFWQVDTNGYTCLGESAYVMGSAVYLGKEPTALTPALYGPTGIAGVASLSVFISPL